MPNGEKIHLGEKTRTNSATTEFSPATNTLSSISLFNGNKLLLIEHGKEIYQLRITKSNKLILTK